MSFLGSCFEETKGSFAIVTYTLAFVVDSSTGLLYFFSSVANFGSSFLIPKSSFTFYSQGIAFVTTLSSTF